VVSRKATTVSQGVRAIHPKRRHNELFANLPFLLQSIATITFTPTSTVTVEALATTTTVTVGTTQLTVEAPAPTPTVYALAPSSQFKIETLGGGVDGRFIELGDGNVYSSSRYHFGTTGNVFSTYAGGDRFDENPGLYDQTRSWRVIYDWYTTGGAYINDTPYLFSYTVKFSVAEGAEGAEQTRTCPITFSVTTGGQPAAANWNCGGQWRTDDNGACSAFQAYAVSQ
jgi:hypothetical protein